MQKSHTWSVPMLVPNRPPPPQVLRMSGWSVVAVAQCSFFIDFGLWSLSPPAAALRSSGPPSLPPPLGAPAAPGGDVLLPHPLTSL